jgi:NitT/TauT family transport system substrate-binding protein
MIRHHRFRFALAALALAAFGAAQADAQTPTKVKMRLDWKGGAQHAPFYLGKQKGYYKDEGLDLDIIPGSGSSDTIKQITHDLTPLTTALGRVDRCPGDA